LGLCSFNGAVENLFSLLIYTSAFFTPPRHHHYHPPSRCPYTPPYFHVDCYNFGFIIVGWVVTIVQPPFVGIPVSITTAPASSPCCCSYSFTFIRSPCTSYSTNTNITGLLGNPSSCDGRESQLSLKVEKVWKVISSQTGAVKTGIVASSRMPLYICHKPAKK